MVQLYHWFHWLWYGVIFDISDIPMISLLDWRKLVWVITSAQTTQLIDSVMNDKNGESFNEGNLLPNTIHFVELNYMYL